MTEIPHSRFNADVRDGGLAFACDRGFVIFAFDGGNIRSIDPGGDRERVRKIETFWRENQPFETQTGRCAIARMLHDKA